MFRSSLKTMMRVQGVMSRSLHQHLNLQQQSLFQKSIQASRGKLTASLSTLSDQTTESGFERRAPFQQQRSARTGQSLDTTLHRLDIEIRKTGRINRREIEEILDEVRQLNAVTSSQSLMIIRCCGELVPEETFENRTKLVQEVWATMEKLQVPMDISHYNALLRVYLENEHKFNPTEFLQQLGSKGLEPNRVTYQRLIARFCQDGDIEGASTILQHMKEKQLPINVHVFNALILGHARTGDMESAEGIIGVMKQAGLEANDDTYATLMRGYAMKGDIENIQRIVKECQEKEIYLVDRDFLEVIFTLAAGKRSDLVPQILPLLKFNAGFNQEVINVILRLINIGEEEAAFTLLKQMPRPMRQDELAPSGNFFIRHLVVAPTPPEKVIKYCQEMIDTGLNKYALIRACDYALTLGQFEKAFEFLEALHQSGFPIRQHYFWPFFAQSRTEKEVYDGLKSMNYLEMSPTVETLRDYVIPALLNNAKVHDSFEFVLEKLSAYTKIPMGTLIPAALQFVLQKGQLQIATKFSSKYRVKFNHTGIRRALVESYLKSKDAKSFVSIVGSASIDSVESAREAVGIVLMDLMDALRDQQKVPLLLPILKELLHQGLGISNSALEWIQNKLGEEITPEVSNVMLQLVSSELTPRIGNPDQPPRTGSIPYDERTTAELESLLETSNYSGGPGNRGLKKALFINYCRERHLEKAEAMFEDLKKENFVMTPGLFALLLDVYCHADKLEEAREVMKELAARDISFEMDDLKILRYALLLISHDCVDECIEFLKATPRDETRTPRGAHQVALVWKILNVPAEKGNVEQVKEIFTILKDRQLTQVNNVVLGSRVKAYLVKDDLEGALKEFEACVNDYGETPWKKELFSRFIKADDADRLQRVMDLSTKQHGEVNSLYDLVFAFLECGKIRQAKKILETPGLRARNEKLEGICQKYLEEDKVSELEQLVDITRDIFNVDRNALYFYLLKAYCKQGQSDKALSVWTSLQEENVQASPDLLIYLANFLRKNNLPVPFVEPQIQEVEPRSVSETVSSTTRPKASNASTSQREESPNIRMIREFRHRLEENNLNEAMGSKQRLEAQGATLNIQDHSLLILKLIKAGRLGEAIRSVEQMFQAGNYPHLSVLKQFIGKLSAVGDLDTLNKMESLLSVNQKELVMFNSRVSLAHVNSGKGVEYFNTYIKAELEEIISGKKTPSESILPVSASSTILQRHQELLPEYEDLAAKAGEKGDVRLYNSIWICHMKNKEYGKAKELLTNKLNDGQKLMFRAVTMEARTNKDLDLISELTNQVLPLQGVNSSAKGVVVSCLLDVHCESEKPEEAYEALKKSLVSSIALEDVHPRSLIRLKEKLAEKNISFPHEIPEKRKQRGKDTSSDSDSDSD